jgi:hypothetical protein
MKRGSADREEVPGYKKWNIWKYGRGAEDRRKSWLLQMDRGCPWR